jgi:uncharacterized protein (TIGR02600 family)
MFGSLPTGVFGSQRLAEDAETAEAGAPWRTLLFRPDVLNIPPYGGSPHPGAPSRAKALPADHLFLDLFWMPVVAPRPMSHALATEGKINMNYQILPFMNIRRATGMHAALKGEFITAMSTERRAHFQTGAKNGPYGPNDTLYYKRSKPRTLFPNNGWPDSEEQYHRPIDINATLSQWDFRFKMEAVPVNGFAGLFRTASEICEMHLVPAGIIPSTANGRVAPQTAVSQTENFWRNNRLTGDNAKERPYSNIYQKLTTRSNTFKIYFKAQALKKAKSLNPAEVDTTKDTVTGEYQGYTLFERFLDFSPGVPYPDYATQLPAGAAVDLEHFYRYRVIETKQFTP